MNQQKIGKFIASCRKELHFTQASLAEQLGITDKAVSKWETGKCLPDISIMPELCKILQININELLSGEHLTMNNYQKMAEENLLQLKQQEELFNKKLLHLENIIGIITTIFFLMIVFSMIYSIQEQSAFWKYAVLIFSTLLAFGCFLYCVKLEHDAGYYQCPNCREIYIPDLKAVIFAPHILTSRKMRCPCCQKKGYHQKVLYKDK